MLTGLGRDLAFLPLDPFIGRMLLAAAEGGCLEEGLSIAAMLCIPSPYQRPTTALRGRPRIPLASFAVEEGDHLTLLNLYNAFAACLHPHTARSLASTGCTCPVWCRREG